jgi:hypothetical protein
VSMSGAILALITIPTSSLADTLANRAAFWEAQAFYCTESGHNFPSKERSPDSSNPSRCDDGDMTLFNGLLCASGDSRGCDGVRLAQAKDGRWWRSPRRIGMDSSNGKNDDSFSPDQALGVMLYATTAKERSVFERWLSWIDDNRPCLVNFGGKCLLSGWPRYCTDDQADKRCTLRPIDCAALEIAGQNLSASNGALCKKVLAEFQINTDFFIPIDQLSAGAALVNDVGYPMHLAAIEIYLVELNGLASEASRFGAQFLALREPQNPFFRFLAEGKTQRVIDLVLSVCPSPSAPSLSKTQWAWERAASEKAWQNSMYWDCIFMANLLK